MSQAWTDGATMSPGMMQLIRKQRLGFVATVNADGTPNLSPKGTFVVVDAATVAFGDIRRMTRSGVRQNGGIMSAERVPI